MPDQKQNQDDFIKSQTTSQDNFIQSQTVSNEEFKNAQIETFKHFDETVSVLNGVLDTHKEELLKTKNVAKKGVIVAIVGIMVGLLGTLVGVDGRNIARDTVTSRAKATVSSCIQSNVAVQGDRDALISSILVFAKDPAHLTPEEQDGLRVYTTAVDKALPYRDCSPAGINKYFEHPPVDPATKK